MAERTLADRRAYLEDGLTGLACDHCGAQVRVRKNSLAQTSVQWSVGAVNRCPELNDARRAGPDGGRREPSAPVRTCPALRDSIERAVREGRLEATGQDWS